MKRSVAIVGPTPMFVRWAIEHPCSLRELYPKRLPETTFRQLRGLREISLAAIENRVRESVCVHPLVDPDDPENALGFPVDEVLDLFGGQPAIDQQCRDCPANAASISQTNVWAGCYGWLPTDLRFDFSATTQGADSAERSDFIPLEQNLIVMVEDVVDELELKNEFADRFPAANPAWYSLWQHPTVAHEQLPLLEKILNAVLTKFARHQPNLESDKNRQDRPSRDLVRFRDAISQCRANELTLHVDLVPPGRSDGLHWTLFQHCGICKYAPSATAAVCPACGVSGHQQNEIKLKVLGLRPYLQLSSIFGIQATAHFLQRYFETRDKADENIP